MSLTQEIKICISAFERYPVFNVKKIQERENLKVRSPKQLKIPPRPSFNRYSPAFCFRKKKCMSVIFDVFDA